jgi:hypothetical protein
MTFKLFAPQKTNKKSIKQRSPIQPPQRAIAPQKINQTAIASQKNQLNSDRLNHNLSNKKK